MAKYLRVACLAVVAAVIVYTFGFSDLGRSEYDAAASSTPKMLTSAVPPLDTADYDARMLALAHVHLSRTTAATSTGAVASTTLRRWPVKTVYPNAGAILPFKRVVAYYGNFYSKGMGVLGEYPQDQMLQMLKNASADWAAADPSTPVVPAIQYIAVVAQGSPGKEGKYILRMPDDQIDLAIHMAAQVNGIVILDVQVGQSTLQHELPMLDNYLKMPQVHLAIDPEFSMKYGNPPGRVIGTFDAADINYAAQHLAAIVRANNLPPKILIVHRFTEDMVTNYRRIQPLPEVQIVMDQDGWGTQAKKIGTYTNVIAAEPVQFTGMKLFYKNDVKPPSTGMLSMAQILGLTPAPIYIQYQ
ncbi:MAG: hypothetical protein WAN50_00965 [Minisyncoccia bacterium]